MSNSDFLNITVGYITMSDHVGNILPWPYYTGDNKRKMRHVEIGKYAKNGIYLLVSPEKHPKSGVKYRPQGRGEKSHIWGIIIS